MGHAEKEEGAQKEKTAVEKKEKKNKRTKEEEDMRKKIKHCGISMPVGRVVGKRERS